MPQSEPTLGKPALSSAADANLGSDTLMGVSSSLDTNGEGERSDDRGGDWNYDDICNNS